VFLFCTISEILSVIYQNVKRSRDPEHIPLRVSIMLTLVLISSSQHTIVKVTSFAHSNDTVEAPEIKNGSRDYDHAL